jgi:hypothetical protein
MDAKSTGTATQGTAPSRKTRKLEPKQSGFAKWNEHGDRAAGTCTVKEEIEKFEKGKGMRTVATIEPEEGGEIRVDMGLAGLRDYVDEIEVGRWYSITYIADKVTPNGSMKIFDVEVGDLSGIPF